MPVNKVYIGLRTGFLTSTGEKRSTEELLIRSIMSIWGAGSNDAVVLAGGDDCAITRTAARGEELLLTTDQLVENQHFIRGRHPFEALGAKALVRSLSDIAAMGGHPIYVLLSLVLPDWSLGRPVRDFIKGMRSSADIHGLGDLALIGGDVAHGDLFMTNVTVAGVAPKGKALRRSGARTKDLVYASGRLGGSLLGLKRLLAGKVDMRNRAVRRHCLPAARIALGTFLRENGATATIDLSDGLSTDAARLANSSGVAIRLESEQIPLFQGATVEDALASGEEYELLFTAPPNSKLPAKHDGVKLTQIGVVEAGSGLRIERAGETSVLRPSGFDHFDGRQVREKNALSSRNLAKTQHLRYATAHQANPAAVESGESPRLVRTRPSEPGRGLPAP